MFDLPHTKEYFSMYFVALLIIHIVGIFYFIFIAFIANIAVVCLQTKSAEVSVNSKTILDFYF